MIPFLVESEKSSLAGLRLIYLPEIKILISGYWIFVRFTSIFHYKLQEFVVFNGEHFIAHNNQYNLYKSSKSSVVNRKL